MKFDNKNKATIQKLFNQIAKNYDKINNLMTFGLQYQIKKSSVKYAISKSLSASLHILDLCCGTGDIAILFHKYSKVKQVIGIDFSEEMLKIAQTRSDDIQFIQGDITNLKPLNIKKESFDICFISFGLRNLPDIDAFLDEITPYIKKNGIISILDLGKPIWFMRPYFYLHYNVLIPLFAFLFNGNVKPYKYFIESEKRYPPPKIILEKLSQKGFTGLENKNYCFGVISQQLAKKS